MDNQRALDVQEFLDQQPFSAYQWLVFALCFAVVLLDGFDTAAIGYIAPSLIKDWGVTKPMVRMSVGIEHIDDILWDIDQALAASGDER